MTASNNTEQAQWTKDIRVDINTTEKARKRRANTSKGSEGRKVERG
jgi:hypothetical protein